MTYLSEHAARLKIFRGPTLKKYPVELVEAVQPFGENAGYVAISKPGPNALDLHIACYIHLVIYSHGYNSSPAPRAKIARSSAAAVSIWRG